MVCGKCGEILETVQVFQKRVCYVDVGLSGINITVSGQWIDMEIVRAILEWDGINAFRIPTLFNYLRVTEGGELVVNDIDIKCPYCFGSLIRKKVDYAVVRS